MDELTIVLILFLIVFSIFVWKYLSIFEKRVQNGYKLQRKKMNINKNKKKPQTDDDNDEIEDFIDSLPSWLRGIADGAGIDLGLVYEGDQNELNKVKGLLDKHLSKEGQPGPEGFL